MHPSQESQVSKFVFACSMAVVLSSLGQILLKFSAQRTISKKLFYTIVNIYSIIGYLFFFLATLLNLYGLTGMPLKMIVAFLPFSYIIIGLLSMVIFGEKMNQRKLIGAAMIIVGAVLLNL